MLAALVLGAVACGDDDEDGNGGDQTPAATQPNGGEEPTQPPDGEEPTEPADGAASEVNVDLLEFQVVPDAGSAAAGDVTFNAANIGGAAHELVVVRTDLDPAALPTTDDGSVDESAVDVIGEIEEFAAGGEESATFDLEPGSYALICNVVDTSGAHYDLGMHTGFQVTE